MNEVLMLKVTGDDQLGLTSSLTTILAQANITILDIGQSVIHDQVSLGMLLKFPESEDVSNTIKNVLFCAHELGIRAVFTPVSSDSYEQWVSQQGKDRFILTLLGRQLSGSNIAAVSKVISHQGLNIQDITRLTDRQPLELPNNESKSCIEFSLRGLPNNPDQLRAEFLEICAEHNVDIAFQEDNVYRRNRRLVAFDMDSTLIEAEVIDELAKEAGVGEQVAHITEMAMQGKLDFNESFKQRMALLKGLDESVLAKIADRLPITEGAERLIRTLKQYGYKTAILSGGFNYFGKHLQQKFGIDYVYANELEIKDGKVTGNVIGQIVNGERKAELLKEIAEKENIRIEQTIAVGDGANDLPMLSLAGLGIAFRAKSIVEQSAKQSISTLGLDGVLYLLGFKDQDII
ncbi:phosphoserine phosphatase SerB [Marinicellulosiphila megalodicopiae]|uniref:phosphoserine phosphatase SerB n=1 Tax=Marinicellulosiphila megalodicopiae TaxID=2724896 RepID=UPI003BAF5D87